MSGTRQGKVGVRTLATKDGEQYIEIGYDFQQQVREERSVRTAKHAVENILGPCTVRVVALSEYKSMQLQRDRKGLVLKY